MKKIFLLLSTVSVVVITSCKKTYSCECTSKMKNPSTGVTATKKETQPMSAKMKYKQASAACNQTAQQITDNLYDFGGGNYDVTTSCEVK